MVKSSISILEHNNSSQKLEDCVQERSSNRTVKVSFECLINKEWVDVPPSLAIYDISWGGLLEFDEQNLRSGLCLKGASGILYRLSKV